MVVVQFSDWPDEAKDPLDDVDKLAMESQGRCFRGRAGRGLKRYVEVLGDESSERDPAGELTRLQSPPP